MRAIGTGKMQARPNRIDIDSSGLEARSTSRCYALRRKIFQNKPFRSPVSQIRFADRCEFQFYRKTLTSVCSPNLYCTLSSGAGYLCSLE